MKKAQADVITYIFLVIVLLVAIFGYIGFLEGLFVSDSYFKTQKMLHELSSDVRYYLIKENGYPLPFNLTNETDIPITNSSITIQGLRIEQLDFPFCHPKVLLERKPDNYKTTVVYILPIANNLTNCPGKLTVYI